MLQHVLYMYSQVDLFITEFSRKKNVSVNNVAKFVVANLFLLEILRSNSKKENL